MMMPRSASFLGVPGYLNFSVGAEVRQQDNAVEMT
jgi:hypothetical protein